MLCPSRVALFICAGGRGTPVSQPMPWLAFKFEFRRFRMRAGVGHPLAHMPADMIRCQIFRILPVWEEGGITEVPIKMQNH